MACTGLFTHCYRFPRTDGIPICIVHHPQAYRFLPPGTGNASLHFLTWRKLSFFSEQLTLQISMHNPAQYNAWNSCRAVLTGHPSYPVTMSQREFQNLHPDSESCQSSQVKSSLLYTAVFVRKRLSKKDSLTCGQNLTNLFELIYPPHYPSPSWLYFHL